MLKTLVTLILAGIMLAQPALAEPPYIATRVLSFATANKLAVAAAEACRKQGYQVTASVVDRNGNLLALVRDPLAGTHTLEVSRLKAVTAASFQTPTIEMQKGFEGLRQAPNVLLIGGGVPVRIGGQFYGAVGVSGAPARKITGDVDDECARAGIAAIREDIEFGE